MNAQNISFFSSIAKEKHGKKEKKFDKTFFFYIISPQEGSICFLRVPDYTSVSALRTDSGNVAQLVEQGPFKAKVPGSSPGIPTNLYH